MTVDDRLASSIADAQRLLARLSSADIGKLASAVMPVRAGGPVGPWTRMLVALIRSELEQREDLDDRERAT